MLTSVSLALLLSLAPDRDVAVRKAVGFLEANVTRLPEVSGTPRKPFTYATTGLVYLLDGRTRTGKSRLKPLKDYLVQYARGVESRLQDPDALPPRHGMVMSSKLVQYTWPLGQTALFFGEMHARGLYQAEMKKELTRIVRVLDAAQQSNGGWGHGRVANPAAPSGYPNTLVSSSNVVAIGLGSIRGIVESKSLEKARAYYRMAQLDNGAFPYDPSQRSSGFAQTNPSRSAGSIYAMHCLGMRRDRLMDKTIDYVEREFAWLPEGHGSSTLNLWHAALACHALGKKTWKRFRTDFEPRILAKQDADGHLACICENKAFGATNDSKSPFAGLVRDGRKEYTTALHAYILLLETGEQRLADPIGRKGVTTPGATRKGGRRR